jgi:putative oxygen-independent coproporphyrinogen III oxidase
MNPQTREVKRLSPPPPSTSAPQAPPPLGLYLHFPYCSHRCPYCDFTLTTRPIPHEAYLEAVVAELKARVSALEDPRPLVSVYLGGGTPGLWSPRAVGRWLEAAAGLLGFEGGAEITLEANPGELTWERAREWSAAGVNRLSLGAQSLSEERLRRLGRLHTPDDVRRAVGWARAAGVERVSLDLIHGLEGQGVEGALSDLEGALALGPDHVSLYQLTVEPKTAFGARARRGERLVEPDEALADIYEALSARLSGAGLPLYEVSNAARPGFEAVHNSLYWRMGRYLGVGAGAHGLLWGGEERVARGGRWQNERHPDRYIAAALSGALVRVEEERGSLDAEALCDERVLVGLRLSEGVEVTSLMRERFGARASRQVAAGLLEEVLGARGEVRWRASPRGRLILDHLTWRLLV